MNILVGSDPELFFARQGQLVSACGLLPGTKEAPYPVANGAVQVDGMAAEFNIDPADSEDTFAFNIQSVLEQLQGMVPGMELVIEPVAEFGMDYINSQPDEARMLGCSPDFNAWTGLMNDPPDGELPYRTAAGHVHIGWTEGEAEDSLAHYTDCQDVTQQLDFFLGLPSLLFDPCVKRRAMYGKAGAFRPKTYGSEYRVLSNKWISDPILTRWVFRAVSAAMSAMESGRKLVDIHGDIQAIINSSDVAKARAIIQAENLEVPYVSQ